MKNAFLNEQETKEELAKFIVHAKRLSMDEQCAKFEEEFAAFQGAKEAVLFNSGGSANLAMLQTLKNLYKLKEGDRVGVSSLTWSTNVMPIIQLGLEPVLIDCELTTLNVMSHQLREQLKDTELQAFFITNVLGFAGDLDTIKGICNERNIILIEDNCEALGTELPEGKAGSFGDMASFSFFVAHHMSTIEGGMVCTNDEEFAEMLRIVRANGWDRNLKIKQQHKWRKKYDIRWEFDAKYTFYDLGYNFRPTEITGFLGRYQLQFLKENIAARERNYLALESIVKENSDLITLDRSHIKLLSNFAFPVICKTPAIREKYLAQFSGAGIEIRPMIAGNIQNQPFYRKYVSKLYD
ncbi:MAG TPA: aminotransferase class I/II-fold pyridoxal phosphate-dependent enzyme, partial [Bacteroidetes bacterium]|nr:aminotransferase class I/II-fold pyridoxal phosphate-dependent enzyme [Bacteroidota bacterium]